MSIGTPNQFPPASGSGGAVSSVFGRTGAVVKQANDYAASDVGAAATSHTHNASDVNAGTLGIAQVPTGSTSTTVCIGDDSRLSNARTPSAHAASHKSGGSDAIKLDELAATTDVATLNASTTAHGLLRKLDNTATHYLDGTGAWSTPAAGAPAGASYVTLGTDATLTSERVLTAGSGVTFADAGAGSTLTVASKALAIRITSPVALSASTTINVTGLDIAAEAGDVWVLDYFFPVTVSGGTAGLKPIFTLTAGASGTMDVSGTVASVTGYSFTHSTTPASAAAVAFMVASFTGYIYIRACILMAAGGTLRVGFTTGASAAGNILAGSSVIGSKV